MIIRSVLATEDLPEKDQVNLFELMLADNDLDGLALLAHYRGLVDSVDARLAKLDAHQVRSSWITRPGRGRDEVAAAVRRERRVAVLVSVALSGLEDVTMYKVVQENSPSPKVQLAVAANTNAPAEVRTQAVRTLVASNGSLPRAQRTEMAALLTSDRDLMAAGLECATTVEMLRLCVASPSATAEARANVVAVLSASLAPVERCVDEDRWIDTWRTQRRLAGIAEVCQVAASSDWCDDELARSLSLLLDRIEVACRNSRNMYPTNEVQRARELLERRADNGTGHVAGAVARAHTADDTQAVELLGEIAPLPHDLSVPVYAALTKNRALSVPVQFRVVSALGSLGRRHMTDHHTEYGDEVVAALVLSSELRSPSGRAADLAIANLDLVSQYGRDRAVGRILSSRLSHEQVLDLPARSLSAIVASSDKESAAQSIVGHALSVELSGESTEVWRQLHVLAPEFPGSLGDLLTVCKACQN